MLSPHVPTPPTLLLSCSEALLGTDSGAIYELSVDEGRKERLQKLHELRGEAGPIAGLAQVGGQGGVPPMRSSSWLLWPAQPRSVWPDCLARLHAQELPCKRCLPTPHPIPAPPHPTGQVALAPERRLVLALAGTRLHVFTGGPTLEALFAPYADDGLAGLDSRYIDLPTQMGAAQLQLLYPASQPEAASLDSGGPGGGAWDMPRPEVFAVLSPAGIYYGRLDLNPELTDPGDHLVKHRLLPAAVLGPRPQQPATAAAQQQQQQPEAGGERPLSLVRCGVHCLSVWVCWPGPAFHLVWMSTCPFARLFPVHGFPARLHEGPSPSVAAILCRR